MIDEEWLRQLRFQMPNGSRVTGLLGTGGSTIVFKLEYEGGEERALRVPRQNLAWHIKEIPTFLTRSPSYKLSQLNDKILDLVGKPYLEDITGVYDAIIKTVLNMATEGSFTKLLDKVKGTSMADAVPLFVHSPALRTRLDEIASQSESAPQFSEWSQWSPRPDMLQTLDAKTASSLIKELGGLPKANETLCPESLRRNPFYVWGAAILDGLYTHQELPAAAEFVVQKFGKPGSQENVATIVTQAGSVADFVAQVLNKDVGRFLRFCSFAGMMLVTFDSSGMVVPFDGPDESNESEQ